MGCAVSSWLDEIQQQRELVGGEAELGVDALHLLAGPAFGFQCSGLGRQTGNVGVVEPALFLQLECPQGAHQEEGEHTGHDRTEKLDRKAEPHQEISAIEHIEGRKIDGANENLPNRAVQEERQCAPQQITAKLGHAMFAEGALLAQEGPRTQQRRWNRQDVAGPVFRQDQTLLQRGLHDAPRHGCNPEPQHEQAANQQMGPCPRQGGRREQRDAKDGQHQK